MTVMTRKSIYAFLLLVTMAASLAALPVSGLPVESPETCVGGIFGSDSANRICVFGAAMLAGAVLAASGGTAGLLAVLIAPKAAAACAAAAAF